jgi:hypothetical protein
MGAEQNTAHGDPMPDYPKPDPLDGKLEPEAKPMLSVEDAALISIAISLKRIADFTDGPQRLNIVEYLAQEMRNP